MNDRRSTSWVLLIVGLICWPDIHAGTDMGGGRGFAAGVAGVGGHVQ